MSVLSLSLSHFIYLVYLHFLSHASCDRHQSFPRNFAKETKSLFLIVYVYNRWRKLFLTFAGETEATKSVTILILAFLPWWYLRRDVRHIQEGVALPLMRIVHALSPSTPSSPDPRTDVILSQSGFAAAMSWLYTGSLMMMMMSGRWKRQDYRY